MSKIALIIKREYWTRVRKPSFLIMTILGPLLLIGGLALVVFIGLQESGPQEVLIVDESQLFAGKLNDNEAMELRYHYQQHDVDDTVFKSSHYTLLLVLDEQIIKNDKVSIIYKETPSAAIERYVTNDVQNALRKLKLQHDSLDQGAYDRVSAPLLVELIDVDDESKRKSYDRAKSYVGFGFGYVMFFFVFMYGVQVMRGVMEEKQSRIVEVLISSVKPFQLMMGKIVGIAMVGLTQVLLWVVLCAVLIGVAAVTVGLPTDGDALGQVQATVEMQQQLNGMQQLSGGLSKEAKDTTEMITAFKEMPWGAIIGLFVIYFLGGYLLYSSLFAAIGGAVDSETDSQQFMFPITIPLMVAVFIAQIAVVNPNSTAVFWCSIIPFTSPIVMMIRIATGNAFEHPWELALSVVLLIATFVFTTWLAGRIYRTGILMYGKKVTWRELGKWLFYRG